MHPATLLFAFLPGCMFLYGAPVPAPGRYLPDVRPGAADLSVDLDVARDLTYGVSPDMEGNLHAVDSTWVWPAGSMSLRLGLSERVGLEARASSSLVLPIPVPVPNGYSFAPILELAQPREHLWLHSSPRGLVSNGFNLVAFEGSDQTRTHAVGAEVPLQLSYVPTDHVAVSLTAFARAFQVTAQEVQVSDDDVTTEGEEASWNTWGSGVTGSFFLTGGHVRLALSGGIEWATNPGADYRYEVWDNLPPSYLWVPQGGLSIGGVWGKRPVTSPTGAPPERPAPPTTGSGGSAG